jgi:hypothetical protein
MESLASFTGEIHRVLAIAESRKEQLGQDSPRQAMVVTTGRGFYQRRAEQHREFTRDQPHDNLSGFNADQELAKTYSENPMADINFKPHKAFSTTLGSASYGYAYSVEVLKNSTVVAVGATKVTLETVEALAKKVLAVS